MSKQNVLNFILKGFPKSTQKIIELIKTILELKKIACNLPSQYISTMMF
jgi:hypothetical protein